MDYRALKGAVVGTLLCAVIAQAQNSHADDATVAVPTAPVEAASPTASAPATTPQAPTEPKSETETPARFPKSGLSLGAFYLSGEPNKLLAGKGQGAGASVEAMARRGGNTFQYVGRVRFGYAMGISTFTVDGADTGLNYQLATGEALVGVRINLMPQEDTVLQPYFEVDGKYGLTCLLLPTLEGSSTQVSKVNVGKTMGLDWIAGIEFNRRAFVEFQVRGGAGTIGAAPEFQVSAAALAFGLLW